MEKPVWNKTILPQYNMKLTKKSNIVRVVGDYLPNAARNELGGFVDLSSDGQRPVGHISNRDLVALVCEHVVDCLGDVLQPKVGGTEI